MPREAPPFRAGVVHQITSGTFYVHIIRTERLGLTCRELDESGRARWSLTDLGEDVLNWDRNNRPAVWRELDTLMEAT